jgi:hypothetical protein
MKTTLLAILLSAFAASSQVCAKTLTIEAIDAAGHKTTLAEVPLNPSGEESTFKEIKEIPFFSASTQEAHGRATTTTYSVNTEWFGVVASAKRVSAGVYQVKVQRHTMLRVLASPDGLSTFPEERIEDFSTVGGDGAVIGIDDEIHEVRSYFPGPGAAPSSLVVNTGPGRGKIVLHVIN